MKKLEKQVRASGFRDEGVQSFDPSANPRNSQKVDGAFPVFAPKELGAVYS